MKRKTLIILSLLFLVTITACSSKNTSTVSDYYNSVPYEKNESYSSNASGPDYSATTSENRPETDRKVTKNFDVSINTTDLDASIEKLNGLISSNGAYVLYSYDNLGNEYAYSNRYSNISIRVPADKADLFVESLKELGKVVSKSLNSSDITDSYNQAESKLTSLKAQEKRLLELIEQAQNISDLITIEAQLSNVRSEIDYYTQTISSYDNQVDYSLVNITISEYKDIKIDVEDTFINDLKNAFFASINGFVYFIQGIIIFIVSVWPFILVIIGGFFAVKMYLEKRKAKKNLVNKE